MCKQLFNCRQIVSDVSNSCLIVNRSLVIIISNVCLAVDRSLMMCQTAVRLSTDRQWRVKQLFYCRQITSDVSNSCLTVDRLLVMYQTAIRLSTDRQRYVKQLFKSRQIASDEWDEPTFSSSWWAPWRGWDGSSRTGSLGTWRGRRCRGPCGACSRAGPAPRRTWWCARPAARTTGPGTRAPSPPRTAPAQHTRLSKQFINITVAIIFELRAHQQCWIHLP